MRHKQLYLFLLPSAASSAILSLSSHVRNFDLLPFPAESNYIKVYTYCFSLKLKHYYSLKMDFQQQT